MKSVESCLEAVGAEKRIDYSLGRFQDALAAIGNPHENVKSLIVSGTNGKGTTTLLLSSALEEAGHSVATYLSPHLVSPKERFLHNLVPISDDTLTKLANTHLEIALKHRLTYFEFLTLLFFVWAKELEADFMVLEVGLGGRLDATNVTDPIASIVTNIAMDHQALLGDTPAKILEEKLGILRPESLLFTGIREPELLQIVEDRCNEKDAIYYYTRELRIERKETTLEGQSFLLNGYPFHLNNPSVGSIENAALAFLALRITFPKIGMDTLQKAFAKVRTPGRMQIIQRNPTVILSGDHNPAGIECLLSSLDKLGISRPHILCGFSYDKPYTHMFETLKKTAETIQLTSAKRNGGVVPADYQRMGPYTQDAVTAFQQIKAGLPNDATLIVTGSLYLIGEILEHEKPELLSV